MAKKQTANIFEAHLEKLVLALAVGVSVWIIVTRLLAPANGGVDSDLSPSELARKAANNAQTIQQDMKRSSTGDWPTFSLQLEDLIQTKSLPTIAIDTTPLTPARPAQDVSQDQRDPYVIPAIPDLTKPKIALTRATIAATNFSRTMAAAGASTKASPPRDLDLVTVEAVFPLGRLREDFIDSFEISADKPLDYPEPIVAATDLQRSLLLSDGAWSPWQSVPRISIDPLASEVPLRTLAEVSQTQYDVLLERKRTPQEQWSTLRPKCYKLRDQKWLPPSEQNKKAIRRPDELTTTRRSSRSTRPRPGSTTRAIRDTVLKPTAAWLQSEKVTLWALDESVEPGNIYRYRIRIGFFNPIAGRDWFTPAQEDKKDQPILWSDWLDPPDVVRISPRVAWFPKSTAASPENVPVDVYRWTGGRWHRKTFQVSPGSVVGRPAKPDVRKKKRSKTEKRDPRRTAQSEQPQIIDFSTGVSIVDIIPNSRHINRNKRDLSDVLTTNIVYTSAEGPILSLAVDKKSWPKSVQTRYAAIDKAFKAQEKAPRTTAGPGRPNIRRPAAGRGSRSTRRDGRRQ